MSEAEKKSLHPFYVDAKRHETAKDRTHRSGDKGHRQCCPNYQLFLEEEGDKPDKGIGDGEAVGITERVKHFFAVPPATFGLLMISEQFQQLKEYLQQFKHQDAEIQRRADGSYLITIKGVDLPDGWKPKKVDILFVAPPGYPAAKPDCFWVSPPVRLANGAIPQAPTKELHCPTM